MKNLKNNQIFQLLKKFKFLKTVKYENKPELNTKLIKLFQFIFLFLLNF